MSGRHRFRNRSTLLFAGLIGCVIFVNCHMSAQTQSDGLPWELNAVDLQAVGLRLPTDMPKVVDLHDYQKRVPSHQELLIDWDPHTGYNHPVFREEVQERLLKHDFSLEQRKQNIKGNAGIGSLTLSQLGLEVIAVTSTGEVRGLATGPSLLIRTDVPPAPGGPPQEAHDYIRGKGAFWVGLPDDPKIEK